MTRTRRVTVPHVRRSSAETFMRGVSARVVWGVKRSGGLLRLRHRPSERPIRTQLAAVLTSAIAVNSAERVRWEAVMDKLKNKEYMSELRKLQAELCKLQEWVKLKGLRVIILFEGRDTAGKGGTIRALTERVSPRVFRVVALPAPSDREKSQMYIQRYFQHFPAAGEVVIFDRSWYNRAGVEYVMEFCTKEQYQGFLDNCPYVEELIVGSGIQLIKLWLEVGQEEQVRRMTARIDDPLRQWKLSPMDLESWPRWYEYSLARDRMLKLTDTKHAPWHILRTDDKKRARLNCIAHILKLIPYEEVPREKVKLPKRWKKNEYDDQASLKGRKFVPEKY
jgi:polyphosphate kinase 2